MRGRGKGPSGRNSEGSRLLALLSMKTLQKESQDLPVRQASRRLKDISGFSLRRLQMAAALAKNAPGLMEENAPRTLSPKSLTYISP